jgi:hypothetical protein
MRCCYFSKQPQIEYSTLLLKTRQYFLLNHQECYPSSRLAFPRTQHKPTHSCVMYFLNHACAAASHYRNESVLLCFLSLLLDRLHCFFQQFLNRSYTYWREDDESDCASAMMLSCRQVMPIQKELARAALVREC